MKLNVYSEELTNSPVDIVQKRSSGIRYTGVRLNFGEYSDAVTIWAADNRLRDLRELLSNALLGVEQRICLYAIKEKFSGTSYEGPSEHESPPL